MGKPTTPPTAVVFYDGVCVLCNGFVDRLLRLDRRQRLRFAPLQGHTAQVQLPQRFVHHPATIVFFDGHRTWTHSSAVIRTLMHLGGPWRAACILLIVPRALRDPLYAFVARRRYRWFGERDSCRLPSPVEQHRFLP